MKQTKQKLFTEEELFRAIGIAEHRIMLKAEQDKVELLLKILEMTLNGKKL